MAHDVLRIRFGGSEIPGLYDDLLGLEVELDEELTGLFRFSLSLVPLPDGSYRWLDDARLAPWQQVVVTGGPSGAEQHLITGYVTHVRPEFGRLPENCQLHVSGLDASVLLDRDDVLEAWPNQRDSDIAKRIFERHGLEARVTQTQVSHDDTVSTIVQRETDLQFLRRLAARNGYECFVEGRTGWFQPPQVSPVSSLPVLAVLFGDETNVTRLDLEVNALATATVAMVQADRTDKRLLEVTADSSRLPALGARRAGDLVPEGLPAGALSLSQVAVTGAPELQALCDGLYDEGTWFVTADGELDGSRYGGVLKPRATVTVKGVGETYSGNYVVSRVTHRFTHHGYRQAFGLKRNALRPNGTETFMQITGAAPLELAGTAVLGELLR